MNDTRMKLMCKFHFKSCTVHYLKTIIKIQKNKLAKHKKYFLVYKQTGEAISGKSHREAELTTPETPNCCNDYTNDRGVPERVSGA